MRHKYDTRGIVLARAPHGEASAQLTVLTPDLGLVRARAEAVRRPKAKLAHALTTFAESDLVLVRGKGEWRVAGAVLVEPWFVKLGNYEARVRAARVSRLLLRLVAGETREPELYRIVRSFFEALSALPAPAHDAAEVLAALYMLRQLGLDTGNVPTERFAAEALARASENRAAYIVRINHGITISGL